MNNHDVDHHVEPLMETLALRPYETATSVVSRVAAMQRASHAREFALDYFIKFQRVASGDPRELKKVADLLSVDADELSKWSPVGASRDGFRLSGELMSNFRSRRTRFRLCPACAMEDIAAAPGHPLDVAVACRAFTLVDPIRTCFIHNTALVQVADRQSTGYQHHDYALAIADALEDWDTLVDNQVSRPVTKFELYLLGRLGFVERAHCELADELDISSITTLVQFIGLFVQNGRDANLSDLDEDQLHEVAEVGFGVLAAGESGVRDFVARAIKSAAADGMEGMSSTIFGRFHYFLNSSNWRGRLMRVKQLIIDRLSEDVPYGPGDPPVLGVVAKNRTWHTLISAQREYGIPYRTIQKLAERAGIVEPLNDSVQKSRALISASSLHHVLVGERVELKRWNVAESTGAAWHDFVGFEEAGLLVPASARSRHQHDRTYYRGDVSRLETIMLEHALPQSGEVDGMVTMYEAFVQSEWTLGEIVSHVADGRVPVFTVSGERSLASIRVDLGAVHRLHPLYGIQWMGVAEAREFLEVGETVVGKLMATGRLPKYQVRRPSPRAVVPADEVHRFRASYIAVSEIWRKRGLPIAQINRVLGGHGLKPVFPPTELRCTFYHRHEVDQILS